MGLLELSAASLRQAERAVEVGSRNISNANVSGYKREIAFSELVDNNDQGVSRDSAPAFKSIHDTSKALLIDTDRSLDLAIDGHGFLLVRSESGFHLIRGGSFSIDQEGFVVDEGFRVLQVAGGGDLRLSDAELEILQDGTVLQEGYPVATIALVGAEQDLPPELRSMTELTPLYDPRSSEPNLGIFRQGMLERSNVVISDEIIGLMRAQRLGEAGSQLVRTYDQLVGQAISTFNRNN